jgi:FAD/FMN-containing dehydrogenase
VLVHRSLVDLASLRSRMRGAVLGPGDDGYDAARRVWNASIDRYPGAVAACLDADDVVAGVTFARAHDLLLAVRGGGHDVGGHGTCDAGLVLDLGRMKGISIDPRRQTARVQPGVVWGELDAATTAHGLAVTGGQISTTGVAGLTLGGGLGWLMRDFGLTIDSLLSVDLVTAEGEQLTVSDRSNPDLLWAVRGAGANCGVVTAFEFQLRPLGEILGGTVAHPAEHARDVLELFRTYDMPDALTVMAYFFTLGQPFGSLAVCYSGPHAEGERLLAPLRAFGPPLVDSIGPMPYTQLQSMFDVGSRPGFQNYWKSCYLRPLNAEAADTIARFVQDMTSPLSIVLLTPMGGAVQRVPAEATAFGHRDAPLVLEILAKWSDPLEGAPHVAWADAFWSAMRPFSTGGVYVNFLGDEDWSGVRQAYTPEVYAQLAALKRRYDPTNLFRHNQNIPPA